MLNAVVRGDRRTIRLEDHLGDHRMLTELQQELQQQVALPVQLKNGAAMVAATTWQEAYRALLDLAQRGYDVQRYKGLGEMNPDQLWDTTMDPETRTLQQVQLEKLVDEDKTFSDLMGDDVEPRRDFINENAEWAENLDI